MKALDYSIFFYFFSTFRDVLGLSVMEREIDIISISHPNNLLHRKPALLIFTTRI